MPGMAEGGNLSDRVIAIAGVGGGLGPAVAGRLAEAGAIVAGANRGEGEADAAVADLGIDPERWDGRAVDLTDEDAVGGGRGGAVDRCGGGAGGGHPVGRRGGWQAGA